LCPRIGKSIWEEGRLGINDSFLLGVFLEIFVLTQLGVKLWDVVEGSLLGKEINILRPAPGGKFVPIFGCGCGVTYGSGHLGQYAGIVDKIWLRRLIWG